jgi:hypothetical protein
MKLKKKYRVLTVQNQTAKNKTQKINKKLENINLKKN